MSDVKVTWNGDMLKAIIEAAADKGAQNAAHHLLGLSAEQVPHDEGILEVSGKVTKAENGHYYVGYGFDNDMSSAYAKRQHEELEWQHQRGRKAKYLEDPCNAEKDTLVKIIADSVKGVL